MPCMTSQQPANDDVEKLFQDILPKIPEVVRKACGSLGRDPDQMDVNEIAQQIRFLLWKNDYRVLRLFKHEAEPETWLFTTAKRKILRWLRKQDRLESLEDKPPDSFVVQPDQEKKLLSKERAEILRAEPSKLTERERKLLGLLQQELSMKKIAEEMRIKRRSASVMKRALIIKLQRIIREKKAI